MVEVTANRRRPPRGPSEPSVDARVLLVVAGLAVAALLVLAGPVRADDHCPEQDWAEACAFSIQDAIYNADAGDAIVLTGSQNAPNPTPYAESVNVTVADLRICSGPAVEAPFDPGPVYVTADHGRCEHRPDATIVDGEGDPALSIEAPGVRVMNLTLATRAREGSVAAVAVDAPRATIRGSTVAIDGGGCSPEEIAQMDCREQPRGFGIRFTSDAPDGVVTSSTIEAALVDAGTGTVSAENGVRTAAERTRIEASTVRGFAGSGINATASDAEVVGTTIEASLQGVRLHPDADGARIDRSTVAVDAVGIALSGSSDPGPEGVAIVDSTFRAGVAVELDGATQGLFVDARGNDWGVYECSAVPTRIRDLGDGNLVDYLPFALPAGTEGCPTGTVDYHAQFSFDPPLEDGSRLTFADRTLDVTAELFDARGDPQPFPKAPDGRRALLVAEPAGIGADCDLTRAANASTDPSISADGTAATFTVPAEDLICRDDQATIWQLKLVSPVGHPVPDAAERFAYAYHNADADDLFDIVPPLADLLDREGTNLQATADAVELRVAEPTSPIERTADDPLGAEVELLDAAGRVVEHDDETTVEIETGGETLMSATAAAGVATFDEAITEEGVYDQLEATAAGIAGQPLPRVTVEPGALDHVTFTSDHAGTTAGQTVTFQAEARDQHGNPRDDPVTYSTDGPGSIDAESGEFTSTETGTATIQAAAGDVDETTTIAVDPGQLDRVVFDDPPESALAGTTEVLEATPLDAHGNPRDDPVTYEVVSGPGAIEESEFTSAETGEATIQAEAGTETNTTTIQVVPGALDHVAFTAAPDTTDAVTPVNVTAVSRDAEENDRPGDDVNYTIVSGGGEIDATTGEFVPETTGTTTIEAHASDPATGDSAAETTTIQVEPGPADDVVFTQAPDATDADTSVGFSAHAVDAKGNARSDEIAWEVSSGGGTIDDDGTFHPDAAGDVVVRASAGEAVSATTITVEPGAIDHVAFTDAPEVVAAGLEVTFRAETRDAQDNPRDDTIAYAVVAGPGAIDDDGTFTSETPGDATIRAAAGDVDQTTTTIEVTPGDVAELAIHPDQATRVAGNTTPVDFTVTAHDDHGNPVDLDPASDVEWTLDDLDAGALDGPSFDPDDRAGTTVVTATLAADPGIRDEATVTVQPGPVDTIEVAPASLKLAPGETADLTAIALDAFGNEPAAGLTWSLAADVGTVDATGRLTARSAGTTHVVVSHPPTGVQASARLTVTDDPDAVEEIEIHPADLTLRAGRTKTVDVVGIDADGVHDPTIDAKLRAADPTVATIQPDGAVTGHRLGTTTVRARLDGLSATANVTVVPGPLARIEVSPGAATLTPGDRLKLDATGTDIRFNPVPTGNLTWTVADDTIGDVADDGIFDAADPGSSTIVVTAGDVTARVPVTVTSRVAATDEETRVRADPVTNEVGNVTSTSYTAGLARAEAGSTVTIDPAGDGDLESARVGVDRAADRLAISVTTQPGALDTAPREVDPVDLARVAANRTDPAIFIGVGATRDGAALDAETLNEVVGSAELTFRVPADYFSDRDLDPSDVTLREYSEGRTVGEVPAERIEAQPTDGAHRYAVTLDSFSSFAVLGGPGEAVAVTDWSLVLMVGFAGVTAAVAVVGRTVARE